ncbi:MAG: hypothetical protein Q4C30_09455 [Bacteroidia bacterium]|nr:hypothetical protein [Bacteroidia bacterium]
MTNWTLKYNDMSVLENMSANELYACARKRKIDMVEELVISNGIEESRQILIDVLSGKKELLAYYPMGNNKPRPPKEYFITGILDGMLYAIPRRGI